MDIMTILVLVASIMALISSLSNFILVKTFLNILKSLDDDEE